MISQQDDSFLWQETFLPFRSAAWTGTVQLWENWDSHCYVIDVRLIYTGTNAGGHLAVNGNVFVSFTVQYPNPFADYGNVAQDAYGDLTTWTPANDSAVQSRFNINDRGADEFLLQAPGGPFVLSEVTATFELPLQLVGHTVYAQAHVGANLCECSAKPVDVPGQTPPPLTQIWGVYIHAHDDDWQLFLAPDGYFDLQNSNHILVVYVTAGDAGQGQSYWSAREQGADASVRYIAGAGLNESSASVAYCYTGQFQVCHDVWTWTYGPAVSVFMRLPDGGVHGGGFPSTNYETLEKLRDGQIASINAVDGSARYDGWSDLTSTLAAIINAYAPHDSTTSVHAPDFDRDLQTTQAPECYNCSDHADHLAVGDAVNDITIGQNAPWRRAWYIDYPICWADPRFPENLDSNAYSVKKATFMAYSDKVKELTGIDEYAQMPWFWENCFHRDYFRSV